MKKIDIENRIQLLANIGVVIGIGFLAYELRQNTLSTEVAAADNFVQTVQSFNDSIIGNSEVAELFVKAQRDIELTEAERLQLVLLQSNILRVWNRTYYLYGQGILDEPLWHVQSNEIALTLNAFRGLREFWLENREVYDSDFNAFLDGLLDPSTVE